MFDYDLEPEVYSFRLLEALIKAAEKEGITGFPVHIKLDTGMHRLGFDPEKDVPRLIERLQQKCLARGKSVDVNQREGIAKIDGKGQRLIFHLAPQAGDSVFGR